MRCSMKGAYHCCFCKVVWHSYFQKFLLINFTCTCSNWLKNFSFTHFLLIKGYGKYSQWKELVIAPFIEWFKTVRESSSWILLVLRAICSTISFSLPLIDRTDCQQGALLKEPVTAPFTEQFKIDENINYNTNYIIHIIVHDERNNDQLLSYSTLYKAFYKQNIYRNVFKEIFSSTAKISK